MTDSDTHEPNPWKALAVLPNILDRSLTRCALLE